MGDGQNPNNKREDKSLLAGLEAGIIAALILLGWLALASAMYRRSIWTAANIGALFGLTLAGRDASLRITFIGVLVGLGWYYLSFAILWQNINPLIPLYTHGGPIMAGHVPYGVLLGRFPRYLHHAG